MQSHPLDGDGLNVELFKLLGRVSRISVVNEALPFRIPDTILYYGSASYWYFFDEQTNSVQKHPAKSLEKTNVYEKFCIPKPTDRSDVVACFCNSRTENMDITYYDREGLWRFLFSEKRQERYGILQRFVEPKMDYSETVQVVHSPTMTFAVRRQNRTKLYDKTVDINLRCCGFDGPSFQCEEYFCLQSRKGAYRDMCETFVRYFSSMEPSFTMKRLVAYFRHCSDDHHYLLFTSSVRIVERVEPEGEQLWGKKLPPFAALKQSLATVTTNWQPNSTTNSSNAAGQGSNQQQPASSVASNGALQVGGKLLQPLALLHKEQLDRMVHIPSRAKEIEALAKQLRGGEEAKRKAIRQVPARLLSPFQTVRTPEPNDEGSPPPVPRKNPAGLKAFRIEEMRRRARQIDAENEEIRKRLASLQRDASSLCMMSELDRIVKRRHINSPATDGWGSDDSDAGSMREGDANSPSSSSRPLNMWRRSDSDLSTTAGSGHDAAASEGTQRAFASHPTFEAQDPESHHLTATVLCNNDAGSHAEATVDGHVASMRSVRSAGAEAAMQRSASSVTANAASMRMRKRRSIVGSKRDLARPGFSPRSYASRPTVAVALRAVDLSVRQHIKSRAAMLMDAAARLSDIFYPLAEVIASRRKVTSRFAKPDLTYSEEGGRVAVGDDGVVRFLMPRELALTLKRELGAYWHCLHISTTPCPAHLQLDDVTAWNALLSASEISSEAPDTTWMPTFEEWTQQERQRTPAEVEVDDDDSRNGPSLGEGSTGLSATLMCWIEPPFVNPSAYTFASKKLQELAEVAGHDGSRYAALVSAAVTQHFHYDMVEGLSEAAQQFQQRAMALRQQLPTGPEGGDIQDKDELHPASNRAKRTSMLQQLRAARPTVAATSNECEEPDAETIVRPEAPRGGSGGSRDTSECNTSRDTPSRTPQVELVLPDEAVEVSVTVEKSKSEVQEELITYTSTTTDTEPGVCILTAALPPHMADDAESPHRVSLKPIEDPGTPEWAK